MVFVEIPDGTAEIRMNAFRRCNMLREVQIPDSVTNIREGLDKMCYSQPSRFIPTP